MLIESGAAGRRAISLVVASTLCLISALPVNAQSRGDEAVIGSWEGLLTISAGTQLTVVFNVARAEDGGLTGTMDSPDQGALGLPISSATFDEGGLTLIASEVPGTPTFTGTLSEDGSVLSGTLSQGGGELPLELARREGGAGRTVRPQEPAPPFPYHVEDVVFRNEAAGIDLAGTLSIPEGSGPFPGVVLVTGSGPQDRDESILGHKPFLVLSDHLTRAGVAVLRFDDRGFGDSGGDFLGATSEDFMYDALAGVSYLARRPEVADGRVGVAGHSEGGLVGPMAATRSEAVAYVVMLAGPGVPGLDILREQQALIARASGAAPEIVDLNGRILDLLWSIVAEEPDPEVADPLMREAMRAEFARLPDSLRAAAGDALGEPFIEQTVRQMNTPWFRFFLAHDPRPALEALTVPVLALFGERDLQVPPAQSAPEIEAAFSRAGLADATVIVLPGLNHLFQEARTGNPTEYGRIKETFNPLVLDAVSAWILERFGR